MITYPAHRIPYRVLGIDPGSATLGVAVLDLYLDDLSIDLADARTFNAGRGMQDYQQTELYHGPRMARLQFMADHLAGYLSQMHPDGLASESPYMGRFVTVFRALTECLLVIHQVGYHYDPRRVLHLIDPMAVKAAVGVVAKGYRNKAALAKEHVRRGVLALPLGNPNGVDMSALDEHSIDAIAVAMARIKQMTQP